MCQENFNNISDKIIENEKIEEKAEQEYSNPAKPPQFVSFPPYGFTPQTFEEKREIKRTALTIGISFIALTAVVLLLNIVQAALMKIVSEILPNKYYIFQDAAVLQSIQIIFSILAFTVPFIVVYKFFNFRISDLISFKKPEKNTFLPFLLFGIGFCAFANIAVSQAGAIFESFGIDYNVVQLENPNGFFGFMLSFIATVVTPALVEEFACRGLILGSLRKFGDGFAIIVSSILFGLLHGNFEQIPFAFLVGLVLGFITVKSGSIWIAAAVHGFNNFISVAFNYFLYKLSTLQQNAVYTGFLCVSLLLGIFAFLLLKSKEELYNIEKSKMECTEKQKYKWFFSSVAISVFVVLSLLEALMFFVL